MGKLTGRCLTPGPLPAQISNSGADLVAINGNRITSIDSHTITVFEMSAITTTPKGAVRNTRTVGQIVPSHEITTLIRQASGMVIENVNTHQQRGVALPGANFGVASDYDGPYNVQRRARSVQQTMGNAPVALLRVICEEVGVVYLRESVGTRQRATLPRADLARVLKSMIKDHLAALETAISVAQNRISNKSP